jgi:hypothetical protein
MSELRFEDEFSLPSSNNQTEASNNNDDDDLMETARVLTGINTNIEALLLEALF